MEITFKNGVPRKAVKRMNAMAKSVERVDKLTDALYLTTQLNMQIQSFF